MPKSCYSTKKWQYHSITSCSLRQWEQNIFGQKDLLGTPEMPKLQSERSLAWLWFCCWVCLIILPSLLLRQNVPQVTWNCGYNYRITLFLIWKLFQHHEFDIIWSFLKFGIGVWSKTNYKQPRHVGQLWLEQNTRLGLQSKAWKCNACKKIEQNWSLKCEINQL